MVNGWEAAAADDEGAILGAVLDLETAPADELLVLADRRGSDMGARSALHSITAACVLLYRRAPDGRCSDMRLVTLDAAEMGEDDLLVRLDELLTPVHEAGGELVTFNGAAHDLPMLDRRRARHWLFGILHWPGWRERDGGTHVDLMLDGVGCSGGGRWSSLVDACAALGVPACAAELPLGRARWSPILKCQVDVVCTHLLHLHLLATRARDVGVLARGWTSFASHLDQPGRRQAHLAPFYRHPHVAAARRLETRHSAGLR